MEEIGRLDALRHKPTFNSLVQISPELTLPNCGWNIKLRRRANVIII